MGLEPVVVLANHFEFLRDTRISRRRMRSRALLWCRHGRGEVVVNEQTYPLAPQSFLLLPWLHSISYFPHASHPFEIGTVHLIPAHDQSQPVAFTVASAESELPLDLPWRSDAPVAGWDGVLAGDFSGARALECLAEYIVAWFQRGEWQDADAFLLGRLLVSEVTRALAGPLSRTDLPAALRALIKDVSADLAAKYTIEKLAQRAGCSPAQLTRLFRHYLHQSPMAWIISERLAEAERALLTTQLPVGVIGWQSGFDDPYYFSKIFKQYYGESPRAYRARLNPMDPSAR